MKEGIQKSPEFAVFQTGTITTQFPVNIGDQIVRVENSISYILTEDGKKFTPQEYYYSKMTH